MSFSLAPAPLARALAERGYETPTPVQEAVLAHAASGADLLVSARTGSGKTVAFGLGIAPDLLDETGALPPAGAPLALAVAPTRELAVQVHAELAWLYAGTGARVVACVGGMDPRREQRMLAMGAHVVVGTPGRLADHLRRRQLDPAALRAVVLDEADEMLDLGFRDELEFILDAAPAGRRTLLFSATLPPAITALAARYQRNALRLDVDGGGGEPHRDIAHAALCVAAGETVPAVINVLRAHEARLAIVFCPTRESVRGMWAALTARGFLAVALSGEMGQSDRNQALLSLRGGRARVCVATDVAARGLDLPELSLVIQAELPMNAQLLLHRSGRTGRAGRKGISVLLVSPVRRRRAEALLREAGIDAAWEAVPDADAIRARDRERLLADPMLLAPPDEEEAAAAAELVASHDAATLAAALLRFQRAALPEEAAVTPVAVTAPVSVRSGGGGGGGPKAARNGAARGLADPVWMSVALGRRDKVELKWLLPLLCRAGGARRDEIGGVRIMPRETRFEVPAALADRFIEGAARERRPMPITRADPPEAAPRPRRRQPA